MKILNHPFDPAGDDFRKMWRFLQDDSAARQDRFVWLPSRLGDWRYGLWNDRKTIPAFFTNHAHLWVDAFDDLLGMVVNEDGGNIFFILTRPHFEYLYAGILEWTLEHWGPRSPALKTEIHELQEEAFAPLERAGFRSLGVAATTRAYDLRAKQAEPVRLPAGFRVVPMIENPDQRGKALLYMDAYENQDQVSDFELARSIYSHENPAYDPALDLSVVAPDGTHVAACVGFTDPANGMAEVEKVCTHRQFRRQGLAEAVIRECFHRMARRGIERAYITGYGKGANNLYEKLGPCWRKQWFHYELARPTPAQDHGHD
jgi:ribosomal protein S18 acetylase RimI-like enzyme